MIGSRPSETSATIILRINDAIHSAATGEGPMNALDFACQCLSSSYPAIASRLTDYKVRVVNTDKGTASRSACRRMV
jgi:hypothetical protein